MAPEAPDKTDHVASLLAEAEREYREAQAALEEDLPGARVRYAKARAALRVVAKAADNALTWPASTPKDEQ